MSYVLTDGSNNVVAYPVNKQRVRKENPNVSFPENLSDAMLAQWNVFPVVEGAKPPYDPETETLVYPSTPTLDNGVWTFAPTVRSLSPAEVAERTLQKARANFQTTYENASAGFSEADKTTLLALYSEVKLYRQNNAAATPLIDAIKAQVFPAQTKAQIGTTIESRVQAFLETAAVALAQKIKDGG